MRRSVAVLAAVLAAVGCKATTDNQTSSDVTLTGSPNPAVAVASTGVTYTVGTGDSQETRQYHWRTNFSVVLSETEGVGLNVSAVSIKVQQAAGGIVVVPTNGVEYYQFTSSASGNRVESHGSASVGFDVLYDLPNGGREALVTVTFSFLDDNDVSFTKSVSVRVQ